MTILSNRFQAITRSITGKRVSRRQFIATSSYSIIGPSTILAGLSGCSPSSDEEAAGQAPEPEQQTKLTRIKMGTMAAADLQLSRYATDAPGEIRAPTLCLLAGRDRIIDNAGVRRYFDQLGTADRELIVYEDAAHTLEFETAPLQYLDDLAQWVRKVIS